MSLGSNRLILFPKTVILFALEVYAKRPWLFSGAAALIFLAYIASGFISALSGALVCGFDAKSCWVSGIVEFFIAILIHMGLVAACLAAHDSPETFRLSSLWHPRSFWKFLATTILVTVFSAIGYLLLVVPGVVVTVFCIFAGFIVIDRGLGPIDAVGESVRIVRGYFWPLLVLCILLVVLIFLGTWALGLGLLVAGPVAGIALAHVYRFLSSEEAEQSVFRRRPAKVDPPEHQCLLPTKLKGTPLGRFVEPATYRRGWWRPVEGLLLIAVIWVVGAVVLSFIAILAGAPWSGETGKDQLEILFDDSTAGGTLFMLACFIPLWIGVWVAGGAVHKQPFGTFFAPDSKLHVGLFAKGFLLGVAPFIVLTPILLLFWPDSVRAGLPVAQVAALLVPVAVLVFLQATAEELVFRGYLLQQLAWRFPHWIVWAVLPSLVFGLGHYDPEGPLGFYWVASAFFAGLIFCALVWRSGSLWPAIGCHFGINVLGLTVLGMEGIATGTQLWILDVSNVAPVAAVDCLSSLVLLIFILSPAGRVFEARSKPTDTHSLCTGPGGKVAAPEPAA